MKIRRVVKLVGVQSKDVFCLFEINFQDLKKLQHFLCNSEYSYDGQKKEQVDVAEYITKIFSPAVNDAVENIENGSA